MNASVHLSSKSDDWATPQDLFDLLNEKFEFELDVCASVENAKVPYFFTKEKNGLAQVWRGVCWMNPPYGRKNRRKGIAGIGAWVEKAARSAEQGATVVCLLPARTDTKWWHAFCYPVLRERPDDVEFLRGRVKFGGAKAGAPFPSVLVVFRPPAV